MMDHLTPDEKQDFKLTMIALLVAGVLGMCGGFYIKGRVQEGTRSPNVRVVFSPKGGCTEAIVEKISAAQKSILIQAYSFTSDPIEAALVQAKQRGVHVSVILDRSQYEAKGAAALPLFKAGIEVRMDAKHQIAHNKIIIIDGETLITGSFNFSRQAEISNAENLLIMYNPDLAGVYTANWQAHYDHSDPYSGETTRPRK